MPLYENECSRCSATSTYVRPIAERHDTPACEKCGSATTQIISAVRGFADLLEYRSPVTGKVIRGRRQRQYDLDSTGSRAYEGTDAELRAAKRVREQKQKQIEARIDDQIERTIGDLDASNKLERVSERADLLPDLSGMRTY